MEINYDVFLEKCPEWAIPMIHPIAVFYTEDGYVLEDCSLLSNFRYVWEKIDDINFLCHIYLNVGLTTVVETETVNVPLYLDLNLYFFNLKDFHEIHQFQKQI